MSNIQNLTSHLKNTTIIPAPFPYSQGNTNTSNGLNKMLVQNQNQKSPTTTNPHNRTMQPSVTLVPQMVNMRNRGMMTSTGTLGPNITLTPANNNPTTNHGRNANARPHQLANQQNHVVLHQQQQMMRKPHILNHARASTTQPNPQVQISYNNTNNHIQNHSPVKIVGKAQNQHNRQQDNSGQRQRTPTQQTPPERTSGQSSLPDANHSVSVIKRISNTPRKSSSSGEVRHSSNNGNSGGAARVQHVVANHLNRRVSNSSQGSNSSLNRKMSQTIVKTEVLSDHEQPSQPMPRAPPPAQYKKGDDVLFTTDDGTFMFGTVGMIHGQTLQILFGDGTQQLASFDRVKLLTVTVRDDDETSNSSSGTKAPPPPIRQKTPKTKVPKTSGDQGGGSTNEEIKIACGSCGVVKKVAGKKALHYSPHTKEKFNCRRCLNKSKFGKNGLIMTPRKSSSSSPTSASKSPNSSRQSSSESSRNLLCFHCEKATTHNDRLHCNLCERACHLSCLALSPIPLEGDRFWDVICSACGTQNGNAGPSVRSRVFSCRRSISSWSDVAHLVLSCLSCRPENQGKRFFALEEDMIPFIDNNTDRLHLPRSYKNSPTDNRRSFLTTALTNASLRFVNGREHNYSTTCWAIRESRGQQLHNNNSCSNRRPTPSTPNHQHINNTTNTPIKTRSPIGSSIVLRPIRPDTTTLAVTPTRNTSSPARTDSSPRALGPAVGSPGKASSSATARVISHSQSLVQKAKRQCQLRKSENEGESNKRKASSDWSPHTPDGKRQKLTPGSNSSNTPRVNGAYATPKKSPLQEPQMKVWLDKLNSATRGSLNGSPNSDRSSLFSKSNKSAEPSPRSDRPQRIRKPKSLDLKALGIIGSAKKTEHGPGKTEKKIVKLKVGGKTITKTVSVPLQKQLVVPSTDENLQDPATKEPEKFSIFSSTVEDLVNHGFWFQVRCLPEYSDLKVLQSKAAEIYASETVTPPPYLMQSNENGAKSKMAKSKRDLNCTDSYEITGRWVDKSGITRYQCEWKDGRENESDDDEGPASSFITWDDLDDPTILLEIAESLPSGDDGSSKVAVRENCANSPVHPTKDDGRKENEVKPENEEEQENDVKVIGVNGSPKAIVKMPSGNLNPFIFCPSLKPKKPRLCNDNVDVIDLTDDD